MASPSVAATNNSSTDSNTSPHTVALPGSISAGDLLLIFFASDGTPTITDWAGFTELDGNNSADGQTYYVGGKIATGSEGASVSIATSANERTAHISWRVPAAEWSGNLADIEFGTTAVAASGTTPDPPSLSPAAGSQDWLFGALACQNNASTASAYPTNYSATNSQVTRASSGAGSIGVSVAGRQLTASSDDPGTFTLSANQPWAAQTFAIKPAGGGAPTEHERSASISGTGTVTVANRVFFSVFERAAAIAATGAITAAGTVTHVFSRSAAIAATGAVTVANFNRDLVRSAAASATSAVTVANFTRDHVRSAAISAASSVQVSHMRELMRQAAVAATGAITVAGEIVGGATQRIIRLIFDDF